MNTSLYHSLVFKDVPRAIAFLEAVGFTRAALYTDPDDPDVVVHAQFDWRDTGGIMFGSQREGGLHTSVGTASCYCVLERDEDVDAVHAAALAAGGTSIRPPEDPEYGGRGCTVADPEGNQWSFGTYPGERGLAAT